MASKYGKSGGKTGGKTGGKSGGGGGPIRALYGVWIDQAMKSNDTNQMKEVLKEAKKFFDEREGGGGTLGKK